MLKIMWFYSYLLRPCSAILQDTNSTGCKPPLASRITTDVLTEMWLETDKKLVIRFYTFCVIWEKNIVRME